MRKMTFAALAAALLALPALAQSVKVTLTDGSVVQGELEGYQKGHYRIRQIDGKLREIEDRAIHEIVLLEQPAGEKPAPVVQEPGTIRLAHRHSTILSEQKDVVKVAIGDPEIADVVVVKKREILINAKAPGRTNVILWYADDTRRDRVVQVEHDLEFLRGQLAAISPGISVETSPDGRFIVLKGTVETVEVMQSAVDAATLWMEAGHATPDRDAAGKRDPKDKPEPADATKDAPTAAAEAKRSTRVVNMITARTGVLSLEEKIREAVRPYSADFRIQRVQQSSLRDDKRDTFVIEGTVASQTTFTQTLIVVDRLLGGPGADFQVVANEGGGLHGTEEGADPVQRASTLRSQTQRGGVLTTTPIPLTPTTGKLPQNNLNSNIARGAAVMGQTGRWVSFLRVRSLPQVLVSVRVLELDRRKMRTLGMNWTALMQNHEAVPGQIAQRKDSLSIVSGLLTNSFTVTDKKFLLTQVISALESKGYARTLSEPNLATLSGEVATFLSGGDVPIQSLSTTGTTALSGFAFREVGIRLTIRPQVGEDGRTITLDINPEISDVVPEDPSNPKGAPSFKRTALLSTAQLKDGEGLILGGLIGKKESPSREQVPILGDIPFLGALFSKTTEDESERELAIILLPRIIYPKPANAFALEAPAPHFPIRGGAFVDPDLGRLPAVPDFYRFNVAEIDRR